MVNRIVIDAGHNGLTDPGAVYNGRRESDDALRLARKRTVYTSTANPEDD